MRPRLLDVLVGLAEQRSCRSTGPRWSHCAAGSTKRIRAGATSGPAPRPESPGSPAGTGAARPWPAPAPPDSAPPGIGRPAHQQRFRRPPSGRHSRHVTISAFRALTVQGAPADSSKSLLITTNASHAPESNVRPSMRCCSVATMRLSTSDRTGEGADAGNCEESRDNDEYLA